MTPPTVTPAVYTIYQPKKMEVSASNINLKAEKGNLVDIDLDLSNYLLSSQQESKITDGIILQSKFSENLENWQKATRFSSSIDNALSNEHFLKIVEMGTKAVPLILSEIKNKPGIIVWALNKILGMKISDKPISIDEACRKWVYYGAKNKLF